MHSQFTCHFLVTGFVNLSENMTACVTHFISSKISINNKFISIKVILSHFYNEYKRFSCCISFIV